VEINHGHYRNSADYEDSVWFCGQVQPYMTGLDTNWRDHLEKKGVKIGSRSPLLLPKEGSFGYAQAQPNMLAKEAMDSKRDYMVQLGARLIEQNATAKTATRRAVSKHHQRQCSVSAFQTFLRPIRWRWAGVRNTSASRGIDELHHQPGIHREGCRIGHGDGNRQRLAVRCAAR
jgi:hypothetical protein